MQSRHPGRKGEIIKKDFSSDNDNSENRNSTFLDEENHRVTATGQTTQRPNNHYSKRGRYEQDLTNEEDDLDAESRDDNQTKEGDQSSMSGSSSSNHNYL